MNIALKVAILDSGLKQTAIAKAARMTPEVLSKIIHGHQDSTDDQKKSIAKVLHKKVADLFSEVAA